MSISTASNALDAQRLDRLRAVVDHHRLDAELLEHHPHDRLVGGVVVGDQHAERPACGASRRLGFAADV